MLVLIQYSIAVCLSGPVAHILVHSHTKKYIDIKETNAWTHSLTVSVAASITEQIMSLTQVGAFAGRGVDVIAIGRGW